MDEKNFQPEKENLPLPQKDLPLPEKQLPEPEKLLRSPTFGEKYLSSKWYILSLLFILILLFSGYYFLGGAQLIRQFITPISSPTPAPTATITPTPTPENRETFSGNIFTLSLPQGYLAEERDEGFYVIFMNENTLDGEADISIDTRLQGTYADYETALEQTRESLNDVLEQPVENGIVLSGTIAEGLGEGLPLVIALLNYNSGAVTIESSGNRINLDVFNDILESFTFIAQTSPTPSLLQEPVFCTQDAKVCPDGSSVGRQGPTCEFKPCP